ncbi:MAG: phasin family protein [Alphaproteobacteria bacterium]
MNEAKSKRAVREPAQSDAALAEVVATATAAAVERSIEPEPEPVSAIVLAQAALVGPACPVPAVPESSPLHQAAEEAAGTAAAGNPWTAFAEAQSALARGFEKAAVEMTGISRSGMAAATDAAVALLGARTFAEAIEINAGLARRGVDAALEGSARLSEIGAQAINDAYRPFFPRSDRNWSALGGD